MNDAAKRAISAMSGDSEKSLGLFEVEQDFYLSLVPKDVFTRNHMDGAIANEYWHYDSKVTSIEDAINQMINTAENDFQNCYLYITRSGKPPYMTGDLYGSAIIAIYEYDHTKSNKYIFNLVDGINIPYVVSPQLTISVERVRTKKEIIEEVLEMSVTEQMIGYIREYWNAFYEQPKSYSNVADMVKSALHEKFPEEVED